MLATLRCLAAAVVFAAFAGSVLAQAPLLDQSSLVQRLIDLDWLWHAPAAGERCVQFSSFDRASLKGPADANAWYGNNDRGQHLRVIEKGGKGAEKGAKEFVMVDAVGPGCVARIWSANPSGTLHFDVDGARVWSVDFLQLCSGKVAGVGAPIAGMHSKGGNCYLPIPFAKSLIVSCTSGDCYYAFDVVQLPADARVESFAPGKLATLGAGERMTDATRPIGKYNTEIWFPSRRSPVAKGQVVVAFRVGLFGDTLHADQKMARADVVEMLRHCLLVVRCGDEETVRVPAADFFALGSFASPYTGRCLAVTDQYAICTFPMPMPDGGSIEIVPEPEYGAMTPGIYNVQTEPLTAKDPLRFHASYHLAKGTPTRPFGDHLVLDAKGVGRFVGCSLLVRNPSRHWWGEGDEKFTVDGEAFPSWFGTGTEDYFGYAWCDPTPFSALFHAQVECQGPVTFGFTQLHRTHVLDSVPFQKSFRFELERWHWVEDITMDYASVAYWYGAPGATSGLAPVPGEQERELVKLPRPPMLVVDGAIEGEDMKIVSCSAGVHERQDMSFLERRFSRDAQLWWRDAKKGDTLVLAVPVKEPGRYKVSLALCCADDYGIVQFTLAGKALGGPFEGYADHVQTTGAFEFGTVDLPAGDAELRCEITGKNEKAKPRFMVGIDYVRLEKQP